MGHVILLVSVRLNDLLELTSFIQFLRISLDESNLVLTNVNTGDEGNYTCVIKSELEQKSASAHLMVMGMNH